MCDISLDSFHPPLSDEVREATEQTLRGLVWRVFEWVDHGASIVAAINSVLEELYAWRATAESRRERAVSRDDIIDSEVNVMVLDHLAQALLQEVSKRVGSPVDLEVGLAAMPRGFFGGFNPPLDPWNHAEALRSLNAALSRVFTIVEEEGLSHDEAMAHVLKTVEEIGAQRRETAVRTGDPKFVVQIEQIFERLALAIKQGVAERVSRQARRELPRTLH